MTKGRVGRLVTKSLVLSPAWRPYPQQQKFVTTLQQSADSLLALVNDLLDISKIEDNKIDLEAIPFGLRTLSRVL